MEWGCRIIFVEIEKFRGNKFNERHRCAAGVACWDGAVVCRATAHKCAVEVKRGVDKVVRVPLKFVDAIALVF